MEWLIGQMGDWNSTTQSWQYNKFVDNKSYGNSKN